MLRAGWLNRQFDEVAKTVDTWPDWMKRAAGLPEDTQQPNPTQPQPVRRTKGETTQERLKLNT